MVGSKITALAEDAAPDAATDWLTYVDVSDTSMAASGTNQKLHPNDLRSSMVDAATGSSQRSLRSKFAEFLSLKDFGAAGDDSTNNDTAFTALRDYMNLDKTKHYTVLFPPGIYRYTNNRWLFGVGAVTINAYGATLKNTNSSGTNRGERPINTLSIFETYGDNAWPGDLSFETGELLETVAAGATTVNTVTNGDATTFTLGMRVLLYGYDQQWDSFPPNARFFEWNEVQTAGNGTTGNVVLKRQLRYAYKSTWKSTSYLGSPVGPALMVPLERSNFYYPRFVEINGATFARNPNATADADNLLQVSAEVWRMTDVTYLGKLAPAESRIAQFTRCVFLDVELDKLCQTVSLVDCQTTDTGGIHAGTGVNDLLIERCRIDNGTIAVSPRRLVARDNIIKVPAATDFGAFRQYASAWSSELWDLRDNEVIHDGALLHAVNNGVTATFTASGVSGNNILLTDNETNRNNTIRQLAIGTLLWRTNTTKIGRITDIDFSGGNWVIAGTWGGTVATSDVWQYFNVQNVIEDGMRIRGGPIPVLRWKRPPQLGLQRGRPVTFQFGGEEWVPALSLNTIEIEGYVTAIRAATSRLYTGTDTNAYMYVYLKDEDGTQVQYLTMDLKTQLGHAYTSISGISESGTNNDATPVLPGRSFSKEIVINIYSPSGGGLPLTGTADQMPVFDIQIDVDPAC